LHLERLPAYAPDLNPVEQVWSHLKYGQLPNFVPNHVRHLDEVVQSQLHAVGQTPGLLKALWHGSDLPFPAKHFT
jgi:putative transposase